METSEEACPTSSRFRLLHAARCQGCAQLMTPGTFVTVTAPESDKGADWPARFTHAEGCPS